MSTRFAIRLFFLSASAAVAVGLATFFWQEAFLGVFIAVASLAMGVFFVTTAWSCLFGAPFVPTDSRNVDAMITVSGLKPGERLVDLGSGDGRVLIAAARAGAFAEGWEISPYLWLISRWKIRRAGVGDKAKAHLGSYWPERFDAADVVTMFLINTQMRRMERKLRAELKPGARVVSYAFRFPEWPLAARNGKGMYLYRKS